MNWFRFKSILVILLCGCSSIISAQDVEADSAKVRADSSKVISLTRHDIRVERAKSTWMRLIPNLSTLQYAGGIGMFSVGGGWDYGKNNQWETLLHVGFLPSSGQTKASVTFTLKENFLPWKIGFKKRYSVVPAVFTCFVNTVANSEFWVREPDRYPQGYYWLSSKVRLSLGLGQRFTVDISDRRHRTCNQFSLYYELSVCDLYLLSALPNRKIGLDDILVLGIGVQMKIF